MAEECKFYYYDSGYSCALKREKEGMSSIDSDTVHRYCWGYHYEECPRYKSQYSSGGCFLTTACIEAKNLSDDCYELTLLRKFRDEYVKNLETGREEIAHYYLSAPIIIEKIKQKSNATEIFTEMYNELVAPCVRFVENNDFEKAYLHYKDYVVELEKEYLD